MDYTNEINSMLRKTITLASGDVVLEGTPECLIYTQEHDNCYGCRSQLGCEKLIQMIKLTILSTMYKPKDFDDMVKTQKRMTELSQDVLKATSLDELKKLPF